MAEVANDDVITFDLYDDTELPNAVILDSNLTQEEQGEMIAIVEQIDGVNSWELIDFTSQEYAALAKPRHKVVTNEELDRLASKNMADNTLYQMKWSVTVIKGMWNCIKHDFCLQLR